MVRITYGHLLALDNMRDDLYFKTLADSLEKSISLSNILKEINWLQFDIRL